jgi:hypothetical protein
MAQNRRDILAGLETLLGTVTGVTTVVRTYGEADVALNIELYASTDLPLVEMMEPEEETYQEMTSHRTLMQLLVNIRIYFVDWNTDVQASYETLMKNLRDKIGGDFKLGDTTIESRVDSITPIEGVLPVRNFGISLELRYYMNEKST